MKWFEKFRKGLFTKSQFVVGVTLTMIGTSLVVYAVQVISGLKVFAPGTPISSADVNANFALINKMVEDTNQKFSVGLSSAQDFGTRINFSNDLNSTSPIEFDAVHYDYTANTLGKQMANVGSFTITQEGIYEITLTGRTTTATGSANIAIYSNASPIHTLYANEYVTSSSSAKFYLNSGTVIRARAWNSGGFGTTQLNPSKTRLLFHKL